MYIYRGCINALNLKPQKHFFMHVIFVVCMFVHVCLHEWGNAGKVRGMDTCMHMGMKAESWTGYIQQVSLTEPRAHWFYQSVWPACPEIAHLHLTQPLGLQAGHHAHPPFYVGVGVWTLIHILVYAEICSLGHLPAPGKYSFNVEKKRNLRNGNKEGKGSFEDTLKLHRHEKESQLIFSGALIQMRYLAD